MNINSDFKLKAVINTHDVDWVQSPVQGVERKFLDRIGDEVARATSIVKYSPNSVFTEHTHGGGEEILVLEGTFSDEHGDYPAGTYLRNPPQSSHSPFSKDGCTLFVKLRQFHSADDATVQIDTTRASWYQGLVPGLSVMPLHDFDAVGTAHLFWFIKFAKCTLRLSAAAIASLAFIVVPTIAGQNNRRATLPPVTPFSASASLRNFSASANSFCNCAHERPLSPGLTV